MRALILEFVRRAIEPHDRECGGARCAAARIHQLRYVPALSRNMAGMIAIITGASRGIGPHIARLLASEGMAVALAARSASELDAVANELVAAGARAIAVPTDVARGDDLERLVQTVDRELGPVDVLVNNAGIDLACPFHLMPADEMRRMIDVNLIGTMSLTRLCLPHMVERDRGWIVNISSLAGKQGPPLLEAYAATKGGLIAFTQSLCASYDGSGIRASVICPGFVSGEGMFANHQRTAGISPPRMLGSSSPEQVAEAVLDAIRRDRPEILVNPGPARLFGALAQLFPRLPLWMTRRMRLREMFAKTSLLPPR
jgi:short-subunit dehydrogenase